MGGTMTNYIAIMLIGLFIAAGNDVKPFGEDLHGTHEYSEFEKPQVCRQCHVDIYHEWRQSMMGQAYTHEWDEIEYFKLAVEHGKRDPKFKAVADSCNGCHTPMAFMAGDTPPPEPSKNRNARANESVSCEVCHTIPSYEESALFNFSFHSQPGKTKFGPRGGDSSPAHDLKKVEALSAAKFCANCHNEKNPWGLYVKGTYNEWLEGPYSKEGVQCHVCHMPAAPGLRAITDTKRYDDMRHHTFHGAHVPAKIAGAIDLVVHPDTEEVEPGEPVVFTAILFNQKAGHKIPTGSVEDRLLYLHVEAIDSEGKVYHLPVDPKGFEGEEYTIAGTTKAYTDFADMMDVPEGWDGLPRDGVPVGDRIFRMPYFSDRGDMTICQWNTSSFGVDYRIGPRQTRVETFTWDVPDDVAIGPLTVHAHLNYQLLVRPVAEFLGVPAEESKDRFINQATSTIEIVD
jgi:Cytochrome c554 and c-prime